MYPAGLPLRMYSGLMYCVTAALLLLYYCFTTALPQVQQLLMKARLQDQPISLCYCFATALLLLYYRCGSC
jgi:hypothetical protein